ncbi:MAG: glycosyltransferase [bacterium]|nr:glycosyltransferase [bacterium]
MRTRGALVRASIIIRTLDEERHLQALLEGIESQDTGALEVEAVIVDSGSEDRTLEIARAYGCVIEHIAREEFSFGRSLNQGCASSSGEVLVFVSGHCVPCDEHWLARLVAPLLERRADYVYGAQTAGPETRFSEAQLFARQYPAESAIPQTGIFCNNANAAVRRDVWEKFGFDESCAGLEDMELAKRITVRGHAIGYVADARVAHHHDERWQEVRWRFEREALALQDIMPDVHVSLRDFVRYFVSAVWHDLREALGRGRGLRCAGEIVCFRWQQYLGAYRGNHMLRVLSRRNKDHYFYPKRTDGRAVSGDGGRPDG